MFDVWLMSVSAITWVFAGLLAATVLGVVLPYGFDPLTNGYVNEVNSSDLEVGANYDEDTAPLVINDDGSKTAIILQNLDKDTTN
ncbi:Hypothetical protein PHPALM_16548 [Phytophthora palmivora]|uniref:Uncharacterized protein n=1 Tax=Phytophthora palmivora TaxID=4796 RepID=A0A2P4XPG8_9STRA|nr:Hypothetical protein PHPALM_16548 [Phytophthora palmivora]